MNVELALDPEQLVRSIADKMDSIPLDWFGSDKKWTDHLKRSLCDLLHQKEANGRHVLCSQSERDNHEFLLDIVVWDRSSGEGVILAVESEWTQSVDSIAEDFWKLLVVKSRVKLMIFALNANARKHTQEETWKKLSECLLKYRDHRKGERYVFIDYAPVPARAAWWIEIPNEGRLTAVPDRRNIEFGNGY